jgi:hypothetical protein
VAVDPQDWDSQVAAFIPMGAQLARFVDAMAREGRGIIPAARAVLSVMDQHVALYLAQYESVGRATRCKRGCAACCSVPVAIAPVEALVIAQWMERRGLLAKALLKRLRSVSARRWENPADPIRSKCPFLRDNACIIYPVRPVRCRGYYVAEGSPPCGTDDPVIELGAPQLLGQTVEAVLLTMLPWRDSILLEDGVLAVHKAGGSESAWQQWKQAENSPCKAWPTMGLQEYLRGLETVGQEAVTWAS